MIHEIEQIAKSHFLDLDITYRVAETSKLVLKEGLFLVKPKYIVESRNVADFVKEVQKGQGGDRASALIRVREMLKGKPKGAKA